MRKTNVKRKRFVRQPEINLYSESRFVWGLVHNVARANDIANCQNV